jgi:hypothetical protein
MIGTSNMIRFLRTTLHPACYHGQGKKPPFFGGWYFKMKGDSRLLFRGAGRHAGMEAAGDVAVGARARETGGIVT